MERFEYQRGAQGKKYGIYDCVKKKFCFGICEDTPMLAEARLFQKIGDNARRYRYEARTLKENEENEKRSN